MSGLLPPRVQQDASLAFGPNQQGKSAEEVGDAIDASHIGPSWGTEYKVHPTVQASVNGGLLVKGETFGTTIDDNHFSANGGNSTTVGLQAGGSVDLNFGPYLQGTFGTPTSNYSFNASMGLGTFSVTNSKDGISLYIGAGPSWGISGTKFNGVEVNGSGTKEVYRHDFK
ncbi:hypothetical protein D3C78_875030 [compost metagenome]